MVQNSAAESDRSRGCRDKAAPLEAYHAAGRGLPLLPEALGCDERRPARPMKRRWRNCSQLFLLLPDTCRLKPLICVAVHAATVAISDLSINSSAPIVRCDPPRPRVAEGSRNRR
jgi:hypothetical protein